MEPGADVDAAWAALVDDTEDPCVACGSVSCPRCRCCGSSTLHTAECYWSTHLWPIQRSHRGTACARCWVDFEPGDSYVMTTAPDVSPDGSEVAVCVGCGAQLAARFL